LSAQKDKLDEINKVAREALEAQKEAAAELNSLYEGIGSTIKSGIIDAIGTGIDALINGTEDLDKALKQIAAGVLKQIATQLIGFGLSKLPIPGFAEGGRPEPGKPAIVGEKGPELFIPDTAGTVVPNDEAFNDARSALVSTSGRPATADEEAEAFAVAASALARNSQTINNRNEQQTQSIFNETMMNAASGGMQVNYNGPKLTFNEADYVPAAAVPEIVTSAVKQSTAKVFADMKNRPSVRRSLGMA
jgi:DNA repair exonuclease SbcCD ATPase subunit